MIVAHDANLVCPAGRRGPRKGRADGRNAVDGVMRCDDQAEVIEMACPD